MQGDFASTLMVVMKDQILSRGYSHCSITVQRSQPKRLTHSGSFWVAGKRQRRRLKRATNKYASPPSHASRLPCCEQLLGLLSAQNVAALCWCLATLHGYLLCV